MDHLANPAKIKAFYLAEELKEILTPLFEKHMDDIMSGEFSANMMRDWANGDANLLKWRAATAETAFEKTANGEMKISEQEYFDHGILMVAMIKAGVELAFDTMVEAGIKEESAYYESLHEVPLIANTIARKKLYEMNVVISDTAEYGCYLFANAAVPLLGDFMKMIDTDVIGRGLTGKDNGVDNRELIAVNQAIRNTVVEMVGEELRSYMGAMKSIS
jgi:ketol-acid reductoisomerase